jgi:uncharacterized protein (DUF1499 family)
VTSRRPLRPCGSRSCVSTQAPVTQPLRRIEPLPFAGPGVDAMRAVLVVLARTPRLRVLERDGISVHALARSPVLRVPFDLDIVVDEARGRIDLRASTPFALRERSRSRSRALELLSRIEAELRSSR